jgi:tRNA A-37 threonylcarbamoyl transferase component Bud32
MTLSVNQMVDNRYRIIARLGQGGMGAVYRAWDSRLEKVVALKEMSPQPGLDAELLAQLRQQFKSEARVLADLSHPHLVRVTDSFSWEGNEYLVMDFVEGESLAHRIEQQGPQSESDVRRWTAQLLATLAYCHRRGVLHRDIKPQNIIINSDGDAVLVDFGLVKLWNPNDPQTRTVMRGAGTPEYAPPEQYDLGLGHTDPRSDIYSLGATLYHALTGQAPPTATQRIANPTSFVPPRRVRGELSPAMEALVLKAMEVVMDRRYQSAAEMLAALNALPAPTVAPSAAVQATPGGTIVVPGRPQAVPTPRKRTPLWIGLGAAGLLCILAATTCAVFRALPRRGTPTPEPTAVPVTPAFTPQPTAPPVLPTPQPTMPPATPIVPPPPAAAGDVLLIDGFGDPTSGWDATEYEDGSVGYRDGTYFVATLTEDRMVWGGARQNFADVVVDVDTTQVSAPTNNNNAYGVACRLQPDYDGYLLRISGDGFYAIHRITDGQFQPLVQWTASDVIHRGNSSNHIRAVCHGPQLVLIVNGQVLAQAEDTAYTSGDIALTATSFEAQPTEVRFDNLVATAPSDEPLAGELLFVDDFSDPNSGWEKGETGEGDVVAYDAGQYRVFSVGRGSWVGGRTDRQFTDVMVDVDTIQVSAAADNNNGFGVMCRVQSSGDGYLLAISGDGFYAIYRVANGAFEALVNWSRSSLIHMGNATNHVQAVCDGSHLRLSVNGQQVAEAEDTQFTSGYIRLVAASYTDAPTEIHFDNIVVRRPLR